ncbi:hypothetical protein CVT24_011454 [Panaeolus cyanescens]|uniref:NmrA-like domain-containing protein n=1 Tax=Panaeolus cyanescens TaxID=181874 RepID=A0A409YGT5_9AGAR|nr:hypothetical protein CVT24_011454 [Panaeolus cyanescens]
MAILIVGGTGDSGLALAKRLNAADYEILLTSRSGNAPNPFKAVMFDWFDASTFEAPFAENSSIDSIYLIGPPVLESLPVVKPFIDLAIQKGVKKFVLLSAASMSPGGALYGKIHQYLIDVGVDYTAVRGTFFMKNFGPPASLLVKEKGFIFSVAEDGKAPFVHTDDIADAAFDALTTDKYSRQDVFVGGPDLLTHDDVAAIFTRVLGREIVHKRTTEEEYHELFRSFGWPAEFINERAKAERRVAGGEEERVFEASSGVNRHIGKVTFERYIEQNKSLWDKGHNVLIASRSGKAPEPFKAVTFDWTDQSTFENPFVAAPGIKSVYLVAPPIFEQLDVVGPFIDFAIAKGVKRFVLLSASGLNKGAPMMGQIHEYLESKNVGYTVLRPTWFSRNYSHFNFFGHLIRTDNAFISVAGDGKIPFVSADDIAEAALDGLTSDEPANKEYYLVGPELLTYGEAATLLSEIIGREIVYKKITVDQYQDILHGTFGLAKGYATLLANNEAAIANGTEVEAFNAPADKKIVGKVTLRQYFTDNAGNWAI